MTLLQPVIDLFAVSRSTLWTADLFTITLADSTVIRWTASDQPTHWDGITWELGPIIDRGSISYSLGLKVDDLDLVFRPAASATVKGMPIVQAFIAGVFEGARLRMDVAVARRSGDLVVGIVPNRFTGRFGVSNPSSTGVKVKIVAPTEALDTNVPANIVTPECPNRLFDSVCKLNKAAWRITGTVTGSVGPLSFASDLSQADDYFRLGRLHFLTGENAGRGRQVKAYSNAGGGVGFDRAWPLAIAAGDTFEIFPGCNKTLDTCKNVFSNQVHFAGMPFVPAPETVL